MIYLDYNATTPLDDRVRDAMMPFLGEVWGNPSSVHSVGRRARAALDEARERTAVVLGAKPSEVVFTSGGTESNNLGILGTARLLRHKGRHLITSRIEHHAVLHCFQRLEREEGFQVTYLPVDNEGRVSPAELERSIQPDTVLASIMAANNEVGTVQPISELGAICRSHGVTFHTDAVQWLGKEPFTNIDQFNADLVSICAHKIHGPKGAGALYVRSPLRLDPLLLGGSHENERRAGTENLMAIVGLVEALSSFVHKPVFESAQLMPLVMETLECLGRLDGVQLLAREAKRLANTISFVVRGADSVALLAGLDLEGVCASSGSACSAGSLEPSHVVLAMGLQPSLANSLVRLSLGRGSTAEEIRQLKAVLPEVVQRVQHSE